MIQDTLLYDKEDFKSEDDSKTKNYIRQRHERQLKKKDNILNAKNIKIDDNIKNEEGLRNKDDIKNEDDIENRNYIKVNPIPHEGRFSLHSTEEGEGGGGVNLIRTCLTASEGPAKHILCNII